MSKEQKSNKEDKKKPAFSPKEKKLRRKRRKILRVNKAPFSSGWKTHPATFAPAGSNRSNHGGNEVAEAFDEEGHWVTWWVYRQECEWTPSELRKGRCASRPDRQFEEIRETLLNSVKLQELRKVPRAEAKE